MTIPAAFWPQSWEMPPGFRVLEASASVVSREFGGETQEWLLAPIQIPSIKEPVLWMRRNDSDFDAGFVVYDAKHLYKAPFPPEQNSKILRWVFEKANYKRQFILNAQGELRQDGEAAHEGLLVDCIGDAAWSLGAIRPESHDFSRFQWDARMTPSAFVQLPALEVWQRIQDVLADPNGDAAFARRFALLNEEERDALVFKDARNNEAEFQPLLRSLIIVQNFWEEDDFDGEVVLSVFVDGTHFLALNEWGAEEISVPSEMKTNIDLLRHHFYALNEEIPRNLRVMEWLSNKGEIEGAEIAVSKPSAHQQLEAHIRWREFLDQTQAAAQKI